MNYFSDGTEDDLCISFQKMFHLWYILLVPHDLSEKIHVRN